MKLTAFLAEQRPCFGALLDGTTVVDFAALRPLRANGTTPPAPSNLQTLIEQGEAGLDAAREDLAWAADRRPDAASHALERVRLQAPTGTPPKLLCFSVYEGHMKNAMAAFARHKFGAAGSWLGGLGLARVPKAFYQRPVYYKGNNLACSGPDDEILGPASTQMLDYEMELALVLGSGGINIAPERAMDHVFGYTVFNDFSARDLLIDEVLSRRGPLKGKDFATSNALGPWIVTKDEIDDPHQLALSVRVNGELRGASTTAQMSHRIEAQIAEASRHEPVVAGEVIATGCATDGCGFEQLRFLEADDLVEVEIEKIGVLRNRIARRRC